jgi:hypothetical protein
MGDHVTFRFLRLLAVISSAAAALLLLSDVVVRDQALVLAGFGLLAASAVFAILLIPPINEGDDPWVRISWGKFFVAIIYASIAFACLVAMAHTPDAARVAHAVRAVL